MLTCKVCNTKNSNTATECESCGRPISAAVRNPVPSDEHKMQVAMYNQLKTISAKVTAIEQIPRVKQVNLIEIEMPFGSMVAFMVKWAIASIPAMIILGTLGMLFTVFLGGLFGGFL